LVLDVVEHVSCKVDNYLEGLIQEMRLKSELQLCDVFSGDALLIQFVELLSDDLGVDVIEFDRE
jgi:hypothetical protein